jgi:hypothetical protein
LLNSLTLQFIFFLFGRLSFRIFLSLYTSVFAINAALFQLFFFFLFRKLPLDLIVGFLGISLLFLLFAECQFIARLLDFGWTIKHCLAIVILAKSIKKRLATLPSLLLNKDCLAQVFVFSFQEVVLGVELLDCVGKLFYLIAEYFIHNNSQFSPYTPPVSV